MKICMPEMTDGKLNVIHVGSDPKLIREVMKVFYDAGYRGSEVLYEFIESRPTRHKDLCLRPESDCVLQKKLLRHASFEYYLSRPARFNIFELKDVIVPENNSNLDDIMSVI